jgi:hypothetical protein
MAANSRSLKPGLVKTAARGVEAVVEVVEVMAEEAVVDAEITATEAIVDHAGTVTEG